MFDTGFQSHLVLALSYASFSLIIAYVRIVLLPSSTLYEPETAVSSKMI
jgi:hypothetical protein